MTVVAEEHAMVDAEANLADYLDFHGWSQIAKGSFGAVWASPRHDGQVAVPKGIRPGTGLWDGTIDMLAYWQQATKDAVDKSIRRFWMDVSDFRATSSIVRGDYIAAEAGSALFSGAWRILRSSATTARGAKVAIGGHYSPSGDQSIQRAMFAQTEPGSYVLPLLVPIDRPMSIAGQEVGIPGQESISETDFFEMNILESEQRRATRTMAQALASVYQKIVEPAVDPTPRAINEAVLAGASRELVRALHEVVNEETVTGLDVTFSWAPKAGRVSGVSSKIEFPKASAELLHRAAKQMLPSLEPAAAVMTGPIFALYHPKGLDIGEATIEAAYRGRVRRVTVSLRGAEQLDAAHKWFHAHETLLVEGAVRSTSDGLRVDSPKRVDPLGETVLFQGEG